MAKSRREWARADDDTDSFPVITDEATADDEAADDEPAPSGKTAAKREVPAWVKRFGDAVLARLPRISAAVAGGLLLCVSFPPFGWWYMAIVAFALLAWVLTRENTTLVGGFGYGFLFGAAFYIPLLPWTGELVGLVPWLALAIVQAVFPGVFGLLAVVVRRLSAWPVWFAGLWALAEWAKSTVPFGGFPWGVVGFGQTDGPLLPLAQIGGAPLVSFAVTLLGFSLAALAFEIVDWWRRGEDAEPGADAAPPAVVLPGVCICLVLICTAAISPQCPAFRLRAPRTNRPSTSPPCRATCRGSAWSSTPSGARCSTTTCGKR